MSRDLSHNPEITPPGLSHASQQEPPHTLLQASEEDLETSERLFRVFVENVKDYAIIFLDPQGYVRTWNEGARNFKGYQKSEIIGKHYSCFYTPEDIATNHPAQLLKVALEKGRVEDEGWRVRKDGSRFFADVILTAIWDKEGVLQGFAKITRDITERKRVELERIHISKLEESNRYLEEFVFVASHDLQEPLRKIQTFGQFLRDEFHAKLGDEGNDYVERIRNAAKRMQSLILDLLVLARVNVKADTFRLIDLSQIVHEILLDLEIQIQENKGKVEIGSLPMIEADATQMRQLFQNLIGNALKYHKPGNSPMIKVTAEVEGPDRAAKEGYCQINVEDNGIGFDNEYKNKIFEIFERLNNSGTTKGSGIGLAICKRIVERHGGGIRAEGNPGTGSVFTIKLPMKQKGN